MINIKREIADLLGNTASPYELDMLSKELYNRLETTVGLRVARQLDDDQLDQFGVHFVNKDDVAALRWLEQTVPHYREIVDEEWTLLRTSFAQRAGV